MICSEATGERNRSSKECCRVLSIHISSRVTLLRESRSLLDKVANTLATMKQRRTEIRQLADGLPPVTAARLASLTCETGRGRGSICATSSARPSCLSLASERVSPFRFSRLGNHFHSLPFAGLADSSVLATMGADPSRARR